MPNVIALGFRIDYDLGKHIKTLYIFYSLLLGIHYIASFPGHSSSACIVSERERESLGPRLGIHKEQPLYKKGGTGCSYRTYSWHIALYTSMDTPMQ